MKRRTLLLALLAVVVTAGVAVAEVCLSPYVKRRAGPEKYLYVYAVDADAKDNDFLAVIDVNLASPTYGRVTNTVDLGSAGNEPHHMGFTDDRTRIFAGTLLSKRLYIMDVAADPAKPKIIKTIDDITALTGLHGPHTYYALPGRMLITFLSSADGNPPGGIAEFTNDGQFIRAFKNPTNAPYAYDVAVKPAINRMITSSFTPLRNYMKPLAASECTSRTRSSRRWTTPGTSGSGSRTSARTAGSRWTRSSTWTSRSSRRARRALTTCC